MKTAEGHLSTAALLDYWLGDVDDEATASVDEHLMQCEPCGQALDRLLALGEGVRAAVGAGAVTMVAASGFVQRLAALGLKLREYRLPHNGSVHCTVAPDDDLLVARLAVPLQGVQRLDAVLQLSLEPGVQHRLHDIPFDAAAGEVIYLPKVAAVRPLPANTLEVTLLAVAPGAPRELGHYTFHHQAWSP